MNACIEFAIVAIKLFLTVIYPNHALVAAFCIDVKIEELYLLEMKVDTSTCIGSSLGMLELMSMSHNDRDEPEMGRGK